MVSDLSTALGFLALVVMKLLSSNLCCALPPTYIIADRRLSWRCLMGVDVLEPQTKSPETKQTPCQIHKGPMEGILIVNGRPRMERLDMAEHQF